MSKIRDLANKYEDFSIAMRREFHMYPELSFEEYRTAKRIKEELDKMGIENRYVTETGIVAEIGKKGGKAVALRADIDALEITEESGVDFASKTEGLMHACGHDAHTASLLTAAKILKEIEGELNGRVKLIFQPAEERVSGAPAMMKADNFIDDVDAILGIHNMPQYDAGDICVRDGGMMFAGEAYKIFVTGKGGHGSMPEEAVDALMIGSHIALNLNDVLAREIDSRDPAVITTCTFNAGVRHNIIASQAELTGTYRCYSKEAEKHIKEAMVRISENTAKAYRGTAKVEFEMYVPAVVNDSEIGKTIRESAGKIIENSEEVLEVESLTGSDDFSYFLEKVPGYYVFIGSGVEDKNKREPIHSSKYLLDEKFITVAASMYSQFAVDFLNK